MDVQFLLGQVKPRTSGLRWITLQVTLSPAYPHSIPFGSFLSLDDGFFPLKLAWNGITTPNVWENIVPIKSGDCPLCPLCPHDGFELEHTEIYPRYTRDIPMKSHGTSGDIKPGHSIGTSGSPSWTSTVCPKRNGGMAEKWQDMARYGKMEHHDDMIWYSMILNETIWNYIRYCGILHDIMWYSVILFDNICLFMLTPPLTTPGGLIIFATVSCYMSYVAFSFGWGGG